MRSISTFLDQDSWVVYKSLRHTFVNWTRKLILLIIIIDSKSISVEFSGWDCNEINVFFLFSFFYLFLASRCIPHRDSPFYIFRRSQETLHLPRHQSEEMNIFNVSFLRLRIEPTTYSFCSHTLCPCATIGLIHLFISNNALHENAKILRQNNIFQCCPRSYISKNSSLNSKFRSHWKLN